MVQTMRPISIQGYDLDPSNLTALYDANQEIYMAEYDLGVTDFLPLVDSQRPANLEPTSDIYQYVDWDVFAGVQRRSGMREDYMMTGGILQNFTRTMIVQELYSMTDLPGEVSMAMQARNFGPLENYISEYSAKAAAEHAQIKTQEFWDIFNYGTLTAGHSMFNHSLNSGRVVDSTGNYIYDSKPLMAKSSGSEHPQSSLVTGTTFYNLTLSLAWSRANYEAVRYHIRNVNNRDVFGRRFRNDFTHIFANELMEQYIEPDMQSSVKDGDQQVNIRQGEKIRVYTPYITDTDAWFLCDPYKVVKWVENWRPMVIDVWRKNENDVWYIRISTYHGWVIKDWHPLYGCNQAEA